MSHERANLLCCWLTQRLRSSVDCTTTALCTATALGIAGEKHHSGLAVLPRGIRAKGVDAVDIGSGLIVTAVTGVTATGAVRSRGNVI